MVVNGLRRELDKDVQHLNNKQVVILERPLGVPDAHVFRVLKFRAVISIALKCML